MKARLIVLLSLMAGASAGAAAVQALHAQPNASKAVRDGGGKYLVVGGKSVSFYGEPPKRIAIMVFDNLARAEAAFNSAACKQAKAVGDKYATFRIYAVEGVAP